MRDLFKDEVRTLGLELDLPGDIVWRHPFPGPGLAVRCLGEVNRERLNVLREADAIVYDMVQAILEDFSAKKLAFSNAEALLLVNGLGATPAMELYLIYNTAARLFSEHGIKIVRSLVGNYTTALDMTGASVTLCLLDDEIKAHWDSPVHTAALRWGI